MHSKMRRSSVSVTALWILCLLLGLVHPSLAIGEVEIQLIPYTLSDGQVIYLADNRQPAAYTQDFVDCLGQSQIDLTRFDVAYYKDNMTVLFHLQGTTSLNNVSMMMELEVYAYGQDYWTMVFDPCQVNAAGLCPAYSNVTIQANGVIPISDAEAALIPNIALAIPDFEAQAILRIFSNSSQSEIACYAAVITNGHTFSHPAEVGSILGAFTVLAALASAIIVLNYDSLSNTRKHYAHTMSVLVIFEVFHSIYFTGALTMNWPSVLPAFWSNYAWAAGMIEIPAMQHAISNLVGSDLGSVTRVGAPAAGQPDDGIGGGYSLSTIFGRGLGYYMRSTLHRRGLPDVATGYLWYGSLAADDLPIPGNYSGFAGTLAADGGLSMSNAFMTGFLWFLIALAGVVGISLVLKWGIELLAYLYLVDRELLPYFRAHWLGHLGGAMLRTIFISFFAMTFLCLFQLTHGGPSGVVAIAAIVSILVTFGMFGLAAYAFFRRVRSSKKAPESETQHLEASARENPPAGFATETLDQFRQTSEEEGIVQKFKTPMWKIKVLDVQQSVHDDMAFTRAFGWLTARYKGSRWWFFLVWLLYQFLRACFLAGAVFRPLVQVFGLLVVELLAFAGIIYIRPYEGQRLNALVVYFLGFTKVAQTALSATFYASFNLPRIEATAIGVVIIVIQALLTVLLLVAICAELVTSYLSLFRDREVSSARLSQFRVKYFSHVDRMAAEKPKVGMSKDEKSKMHFTEKEQAKMFDEGTETPSMVPEPEPAATTGPYFRLGSIRRINKIEDDTLADDSSSEGEDDVQQLDISFDKAVRPERRGTQSSANSISSRRSRSSLPYGARETPRRSWSLRESNDSGGESGRVRRSHSVTASSAYTTLNSSLEDLRSGNSSPVPPVPSLASSPYFERNTTTIMETGMEVRPLSPSGIARAQIRPRSATMDAISPAQSFKAPLRPMSPPRARVSAYEPAPSQDPADIALAAARLALHRTASARSQSSARLQRTMSVRSQASDARQHY